MTDYLKPLPIAQVAGWYRRLANLVGVRKIGGRVPYAALLLGHYLDNRDPNSTFVIDARTYLTSNARVLAALAYHRRVFLSQEEARIGKTTRLAGVVPRLRARDAARLAVPGQALIDYESLVQIGDGMLDIWRIQNSGTDSERDLFTSLRGFQLHSQVLLQVKHESNKVRVDFTSWKAHALDRYDWNYSEHLTMPNPDFGSKARNAVRPMDQQLTVYHANAKRLEDAKLAAPFNVKSAAWSVVDAKGLTAPALVTP
jgi:hypothetical protein